MPVVRLTAPLTRDRGPLPPVEEPLRLTLQGPIEVVHRMGRRADEELMPEVIDADTRARLEDHGYRWNGTLARWWKYIR